MNPLPSDYKVAVILLAGGMGERMQLKLPKQYLLLGTKPIARHSFDTFLKMPEIDEIVVVCLPEYQDLFHTPGENKKISFALPGHRRQDSCYNGFLQASPDCQFICIHDGCRPFIDATLVKRAIDGGFEHGAATVGMPVKFTVKQCDNNQFVHSTPDRALMWEIQTPQVVRRDLLESGFHFAKNNNLTATDDVSLVEMLGRQVKLIVGSDVNIKITVPSDLTLAEQLLAVTKGQEGDVS